MNILIADDERPSRGELRYILDRFAPDATFYEAINGQAALDMIDKHAIDVVFLDIKMPGIDGLSAAAKIMQEPDPPLIVFATAYDAHALRAFELAALDYVVKPFLEQRLEQTMKRIRETLRERDLFLAKQDALRSYISAIMPQQTLSKLWGERDNKTGLLVDYGQIMWVVAESKKVYIHTIKGANLLVKHTIKELEPKLAAHNFARVHKAYLVNLDYVAEVVPWFSGTYLIRMTDEARTEIPMSRQYGRRLKQRIG